MNDSGLAGALTVFLVVYLAIAIVAVWAAVRVIRRSGYSGWWVLIGLVPVVNVVMYLVFAFKEAPTERELKQLRAWAAQSSGYGGQHPGWGGQQPGYGGQYPSY